MTSLEEVRLVEAYRAGDPEVFDRLVRAYQPALLAHALRKLHDRAAAEDAVQETFVRAYRALPRFDGEHRLGGWLHHILANVCIDEANRRRREHEKFDRVAARADVLAPAPGVEQQLGFDVDDGGLRDALSSLPPTYRQALALRFVDELSYDEVAEVAGVSAQNARARVSRARTAMRLALRGVALVPVMVAGALRRGERVAAALPGEAVRAGANATTGAPVTVSAASSSTAASVVPMSSALAPAVEVANTVVAASPQAMPLITKAAIGLGMAAAVAVPTAGSSVMNRTPAAPEPAAPAVVVPAPEPVAGLTEPGPAVTPGSTAETGTPTTTSATTVVPTTAPPADTSGGSSAAPSSTAGPSTTVGSSTTTVVSPAPTTAVRPPSTAAPAPSTSTAPTTAPSTTAAPPTTVAPSTDPTAPVRAGGTLSATGLVTVPAGPRFDVSGPASLTIGGSSRAGRLTGRLAVGEVDAAGRQRIDGVLTLTVDGGGTLELRLAGQSTAVDPGAPGSVELAGPFRAVGNAVDLVESGTATGAVDLAAGTVWLTLAG